MPNEGDEIALATGFDAEHAEAVVGVMEGDAVDQSRQHLRRAHRRYLRHSRDDGCGAGETPELLFLISLKPVSRGGYRCGPGVATVKEVVVGYKAIDGREPCPRRLGVDANC